MIDLDRPLRDTDLGFFGPNSVSWRLWSAPTALIAFQRAVTLEHFDPHLAASVADAAGIYTDPFGRLDRTLGYFLLVALADGRTAIEASEHLQDVHRRSAGIDPVTGTRYSANNPESQLWIHLTGWHSVLKCAELYGGGPLSPEDEARYWAECRIAAELQTCDPADVPDSRDGVREYFERVRPSLAVSERARRGMHYLLRTKGKGARARVGSELLAPAAIGSLPKWMRELGGFDQPRVVDAAYRPAVRVAVAAAGAAHSRMLLAGSSMIAPTTGKILRKHLTEGTGTGTVVTPAQARAQYGRRAVAS